jgi:hypothetical protein
VEKSKEILKKAMDLPPSEKAEFIDRLLSSLEKPDRDLSVTFLMKITFLEIAQIELDQAIA